MVSQLAAVRHVSWPKTYRIIRTIYPPIDLFEDIADPRDWETLAAVEAKTNPLVRDEIGDLGKVPLARRVGGPGASLVMAPFVHCSINRPGRFTDGSYGIWCAGDSEEVALAETIYHHQKLMTATNEEPGWTSDFRVLISSLDRPLHDVNDVADALHPENYAPSRLLGAELRGAGSDGLTWNSVRQPGGGCVGLFWPDVVPIPIQGSHFGYHWNGAHVDYVKRHDTGEILAVA